MRRPTVVKTILTDTLAIAYEESGRTNGKPVILLHGFPDDPRSWDSVVGPLTADGFRMIVPYLRGFGPTRFLHSDTPRSGQQAALARFFIDLQPEHIRTRIVADHVQVELPFGDLAGIEIGGKDLLTRIIWPRQHATERIDNHAAAADQHGLRIITLDRRVIRRIFAAADILAGRETNSWGFFAGIFTTVTPPDPCR